MPRTLCLLLAAFVATGPYLTAQITVSFPASVSPKPLDGRVLLLLSTDPAREPRMQIDDSPRSQIIFGTTVDGLAPDQAVTITNEAAGGTVARALRSFRLLQGSEFIAGPRPGGWRMIPWGPGRGRP